MKKYIFIAFVLFTCLSVNAQVKGKIRVGGNLGLTVPAGGGGFAIDILDIRYNILNNLNAGVKFGGAFMIRDMSQLENSFDATMHINSNFMLVSDFYFNKGGSFFAPFIGGSIGSFSIYDIYMLGQSESEFNYTIEELPNPSKTLGGALRTGFEAGKFRMALEYYLIPATTRYDVANIMQPAGTSANSYLSLNVGFYFGGGKWKK